MDELARCDASQVRTHPTRCEPLCFGLNFSSDRWSPSLRSNVLSSLRRDLWGPFVEIKKNHMNPLIKRPPFPHITLLAPFTEYSAFPQAATYLRKYAHTSRDMLSRNAEGVHRSQSPPRYLEQIEPFQLAFNRFELFMNGGSNTLYLEPVVTPKGALQVHTHTHTHNGRHSLPPTERIRRC